MITATAATIALILLALAMVLAVGRAIAAALRRADHQIDTILDDELGPGPEVDEETAERQLQHRPGDDDQFARWAVVRTHEGA